MSNNHHDSAEASLAAETRTPVTGDEPTLELEVHNTSAELCAAGGELSSTPDVPPWITEFIDFYRERFGESLVLLESGTQQASITRLLPLTPDEQAASDAISPNLSEPPQAGLFCESAPQEKAGSNDAPPPLPASDSRTLRKHGLLFRVKRLVEVGLKR